MESTISLPQDVAAEPSASLSVMTPARPTLDGLPPELHCHIATFLSPISKALFALSCRRIYYDLDTTYVEYLRDPFPPHRQDFLEILEEDLPEYISCGRCLKLHHVRPFDGPQCAGYHNTCTLPKKDRHHGCHGFDNELRAYGFVHLNFSHIDFQKVMKLHRRGRDTTELLEKLSLKPLTQLEAGHVKQTSAVARILDHQERASLVVRQQSIWLRCTSRSEPTPNWRMIETLCPHYYINSIEPGKICLAASYGGKLIVKSEYFQRCQNCSTEFRIDEKDYGRQCSALFITQWIDYGQGRAVKDTKWAWRAYLAPTDWHAWSHYMVDEVLCLQFEGKEWNYMIKSLLTLTAEDEAALFDAKLRKL